jgi:hypothetical protein
MNNIHLQFFWKLQCLEKYFQMHVENEIIKKNIYENPIFL